MTPVEVLEKIIKNKGECDTRAMCGFCPLGKKGASLIPSANCVDYVAPQSLRLSESTIESVNKLYLEAATRLLLDIKMEEILEVDDAK